VNPTLAGRDAQRERIRGIADPDALALAASYGIDLADINPGISGASPVVTTYHVELAVAAHALDGVRFSPMIDDVNRASCVAWTDR
jgi:hypothetical protein